MLAAGVMSGTSLDGIDVVICEISGFDVHTNVRQLAFETIPFENCLKKELCRAIDDSCLSAAFFSRLNVLLGRAFGHAVVSVCRKSQIATEQLAFVASHGQTIAHYPKDQEPHSWQIGSAAEIAVICHTHVISNFRAMDIALGGQGAPLVPYSEALLYRDATQVVALQNIGGIGNITILPALNDCQNDIVAYDTGPGNMMIDEAMSYYFNQPYDKNGAVAARGKLIDSLQERLKKHPYLYQPVPKSTGRELFGIAATQQLLKQYACASPEDVVATLTWYSAYCIAWHLQQETRRLKQPVAQLIVSGGGAHNDTMLSYLKSMLPRTKVCTQEAIGYSSDAKEAVAFVVLGNQTWHRRPSNIPSVTGAKNDAILGDITYYYGS